jgi:hypothetical protein
MEASDAAAHQEWLRRYHGALLTPRAIIDAQVGLLLTSYPGGMDVVEHNQKLIALMALRRALWMLMVDQDRANPGPISDHIHHLNRALTAL